MDESAYIQSKLLPEESAFMVDNAERCVCGHMMAFHFYDTGTGSTMNGESQCQICSCPWNAYGYNWHEGDPFRLQSEKGLLSIPRGWKPNASGDLVRE